MFNNSFKCFKMKTIFLIFALFISLCGQAQKTVELEVNFMFEFLCESKENYKSGFDLLSKPSYNIDAIRIGTNKVKIDLVNKKMINDSEVDGIKLHEEYVLDDLIVRNDTIRFVLNHEETLEGKFYKFKSCFTIALNAKDSDFFVINSWMREDLNRIEGTIVRRKGSVLVVH